MIVRDNSGQYSDLFKQLNKALNYTGDKEITDINAYFMELKNIRDGVLSGSADFDPYMLILPNEKDEPFFAINANTRAIEVPSVFKTGVGVQGDTLAEIIYFSIDRYFDLADLYDKEIFVQWEAPNGDKGLSYTINKTLNLLPNKVVFGWPISQEMTKKAGDIKFAVRFYERESSPSDLEVGPKLIYSFSTLTATIKINPGLDFNIDTKEDVDALGVIDNSRLIYDMMRNSTAAGLDTRAVAPTIDEKNCSPAFIPAEFDVGQALEGRAMFKSEDPEDGRGTISYSWYRSLDDSQKDGYEIKDVAPQYKLTSDSARDSNDIYFIKNNESYTVYNGSLPADNIYKLYTSYIPTQAGYYYFKATNSAGRGNEKSINSKNWLISFAKAPEIDCSNFMNIVMEDGKAVISPKITNVDNGSLSYQWFKGETINSDFSLLEDKNESSIEVSEEGYYYLKVVNNKNGDNAEAIGDKMRITMPASDIPSSTDWVYYVNGVIKPSRIASIGSTLKIELQEPLQKSDDITYQWYYSTSGEDNDYTLLPGKTSQEYLVEQTGFYRVKVINIYNLDVKEANSEFFTVAS